MPSSTKKTLQMTDLVSDPDNPRSNRHRELEKAEIAKSEWAVICVIDAINSFTNPFNIANKDKLYCLASGALVLPMLKQMSFRQKLLVMLLRWNLLTRAQVNIVG